jgi:ligand-binding sensor domain-containing protein
MAIDSSNTKWFFTTDGVYSLKNNKWVKYSENETGIKGGYRIINNSKTDEVFFCSERGLTILKNREWKLINLENTPGLPSSKISFAKRDSKNRIWIGTAIGSAMIDENNIVTNFQNSNTVLKDKRIRFMDEDEQGNIYFTLYEFNPKDKKQINNNEGIAVRYTDGTFKQFTTENSGMPFNYANCLLYDKREKVIWISTERAGLVRFDPKSGWENYHNQNSDIPTSYILDMTFDSEGNLYLATQLGLVKVEKK